MTQADLNNVRWKVDLCKPTGASCWCRTIGPEVPMFDEAGAELYVVGSGSIPKVNAEHIVRVHNESLPAVQGVDKEKS